MDRSTDLVFGAGRFICLGRDIALTQLLKMISEVSFTLRHFSSFCLLFFLVKGRDKSLVWADHMI